MKVFGEGFSQAIGECFEQDGLVVVMRRFEFIQLRFDSQSCGDGEKADVIPEFAFFRIFYATVEITQRLPVCVFACIQPEIPWRAPSVLSQ